MPDFGFTVILPLYSLAAVLGLVAHRARVARAIGRDPVVVRPFADADAPFRFLETALALGAIALLLDVVLNAVLPHTMREHFAIPVLRRSRVVGWCGLTAVSAGVLVSGAAVIDMATAWRVGIDRENPGALVSSGLFRYIRHPIYAGMLLMTAGMAAATADVLSIAVAAGSWIGIPLQARLEEEFLISIHGVEYEKYRATSGRFWPRRPNRRS